jgi:hypothetical protein
MSAGEAVKGNVVCAIVGTAQSIAIATKQQLQSAFDLE